MSRVYEFLLFCFHVPPLLVNPFGIIYLAVLIVHVCVFELESRHLDLGHSKCYLVWISDLTLTESSQWVFHSLVAVSHSGS